MNWRSSLTPMLDAQTLQTIDAWVEGKRPAPIGPAEGRLLASADAALERSIRGASELVPAVVPPPVVDPDREWLHGAIEMVMQMWEHENQKLLLSRELTTDARSYRPGEILLIDRRYPGLFRRLERPSMAADGGNFADDAAVRKMRAELPGDAHELVGQIGVEQRAPEQGYTYRWSDKHGDGKP
jgi:hypothetical protein